MLISNSTGCGRFATGLILICLLAALGEGVGAKKIKCQGDECSLQDVHFRLYSTVKRALNDEFNLKGKDIIPLLRSVEVLRRRFAASGANQPEARQLNGTTLVLGLLESEKLHKALAVFHSDEGRELINVYRGPIDGNQQKLACSQWRVEEIELATKRLAGNPKLAEVFGKIHKNFVERSARKCLKSSCSSLDESMNRLDSVLRQSESSRRRGFQAADEAGPATGNSLDESTAVLPSDEEQAGEFQREELELCQFFKRTNESQCQASGNELSEISFVRPVKVNNETIQSSLDDFLIDYRRNKSGEAGGLTGSEVASSGLLLAQCRSLQPLLHYHMSGLRWFQKHELITGLKLRVRTFWCPSLSYWLEIDRLCNELESKLSTSNSPSARPNTPPPSVDGKQETFAY